MARKLVAVCVAALALLLVSSLWDPADARRNGGGGGRGWSGGGGHHHSGRSFSGRSHGGGSFHRGGGHSHRFHSGRSRHAYLYGVPFGLYGGYAYGYSDGCHWLRQRALYTGSPYWWDRYNSCRYGYNDYYNHD
jgi:hypothetical protein